jgi:hypothetical protein
MRVRKAGATWVHERRADDTDATFVRTICGMSFTVPTAQLYAERWAEVTCPSCVEKIEARERVALIASGPAAHEFRPKTGELALVWAGPHVEIVTAGGHTTVFLDGVEVPCTHVTHVDTSRDVPGDVTGTPAFVDLLAAESGTQESA